ASGWTGLGSPPGAAGYRYRDSTGAAGCRQAIVKRGHLKLTCSRGGVSFSLDEQAQHSLVVTLAMGAGWPRYCASFGGALLDDRVGRFRAKDAPVPLACPDAP